MSIYPIGSLEKHVNSRALPYTTEENHNKDSIWCMIRLKVTESINYMGI